MMLARDVSARIGDGWAVVLARLGIEERVLDGRHHPCPACGGRDRFRFDNKFGAGNFYCNGCGAGSGFDLVMRVNGWNFKTALQRVIEAAGIADTTANTGMSAHSTTTRAITEFAAETDRVRRLRRETCAIADCTDAVRYLSGRGLWPLAEVHDLRAHVSVDYFDGGRRIGRYAALVATVRDINDASVTAHITYLRDGRKLADHEPRKLLSPLTGRTGCAVRLFKADGDALGVAEGVETALAAWRLHRMPVWAALSAALLAKFEPPPAVRRLVIFADRDAAGLEAAARLMERLQGRVQLELRTPAAPAKDWADAIAAGEVAA